MVDSTKFIVSKNASINGRLGPGEVPIEAPDSIELTVKINSTRVCVAPIWKSIIRYFLYVSTGFIMYLLCLWFHGLKIALKYSSSNMANARYVIVSGADGKVEVLPLETVRTEQTIRVFTHRLFKYYFDEKTNTFKPAHLDVKSMSYKAIHSELKEGLNERQVEDNRRFYGKNQTDIPTKPWYYLLFKEILTPFYIFQVFSCIIWCLDDYYAYAVVIFVFSGISVITSLVETKRTIKRLSEMSHYETQVQVIRKKNDQQQTIRISSSELVPGDIMLIETKIEKMPCDVILLNGTCIMNEAMLTGESVPVVKNELPNDNTYYNSQDNKQFTLFAGTKCIQTRHHHGNGVLGLVSLTGFSTMKGELIRTILYPKPSDFKFYADSFKFVAILAFMAVCGFLIDLPSFISANSDPDKYDLGLYSQDLLSIIIIKAAEIVTITVPPALPTCMQVGISIAIRRLQRENTYCISPSKINETGRVNVMCFDKTGTLTEDSLNFLGVLHVKFDDRTKKLDFTPLTRETSKLTLNLEPEQRLSELKNYLKIEGESNKNGLYSTTDMLPSEHMLHIMATCHSLNIVKNELTGDPLDLIMTKASNWDYEENENGAYEQQYTAIVKPGMQVFDMHSSQDFGSMRSRAQESAVGIIRRFEFSSQLQRMSVIVKPVNNSAEYRLHMKGSPERIHELCDPASIPEDFHSALEQYTREGYRVLGFASKNIGTNYKALMSSKREELEHNLTFIGFLVMENKLKKETTEVIDVLHKAKIGTIMVTGDNILTAISVARQCHIINSSQKIYLGDVDDFQVNGKDVVRWTDLVSTSQTLNTTLDGEKNLPEIVGELSDFTRKMTLSQMASTKKHLESLELSFSGDATEMINWNVIDLEAPFFNLPADEEYCIAITGKAFSVIVREAEINKDSKYKQTLDFVMKKCRVYARMHPDEKAAMIKRLMLDRKRIVGMCGDGANDVAALKSANVGISLSEAEASIAAPFTSKTNNISCVPTLLREGRSALATSYQAFKYMALYSIIQFASITIMYYNIVEFSNWHYYHIDLIIILPLSATMAMSQTYEKLTEFRPTGGLISMQVLCSVIGQGVIQILFQLFAFALMGTQDMTQITNEFPCNFETQSPCAINTTLYLVSIYQYCVIGFAFLVGKPFRKSFYTNKSFTLVLILLIALNLIVTFNPFGWQFILANNDSTAFTMNLIVDFSIDWKFIILLIVLNNTVCTIAWENTVVPAVSRRWKLYRSRRQLKHESSDSIINRLSQPKQADHNEGYSMTVLQKTVI